MKFQANNGDLNARCELGKFYLAKRDAIIVSDFSKDSPQRSEWLQYFSFAADEFLLAAEKGHGEAAYIYAYLCSPVLGDFDRRYHQIAVKAGYPPAVLEKRANDGDADAAEYLYELHLHGNVSMSLPINKEKAQFYLAMFKELKANEPNSIIKRANANFELGESSRRDKNLDKALYHYGLALKDGHQDAAEKMADIYAVKYNNSWSKLVHQDWYEQAIILYELAGTSEATIRSLEFQAENGDSNADCALGLIYFRKYNDSPKNNNNLSLAKQHMIKAAEAGHGEAAYALFTFYGPSKEGAIYFEMAAKNKYPPAVKVKEAQLAKAKADKKAAQKIAREKAAEEKRKAAQQEQERAEKEAARQAKAKAYKEAALRKEVEERKVETKELPDSLRKQQEEREADMFGL